MGNSKNCSSGALFWLINRGMGNEDRIIWYYFGKRKLRVVSSVEPGFALNLVDLEFNIVFKRRLLFLFIDVLESLRAVC
jgi:hypothetical protein